MGSLDTPPALDATALSTEKKIDKLLANFLYPSDLESLVFIPRFKQRLTITRAWDIGPPKPSTRELNFWPLRILDIGCGQGESSVTLAVELGPTAQIVGVDTAPPDYGGPFTVGETQAHVAASTLGSQISFKSIDTASLLAGDAPAAQGEDGPPFDAATLCHSLWYFPNPESVRAIFATLAIAGIPRVYLAEYAFNGSLPGPEQTPHVLAARAQALFHASKAPREPGPRALNVRTAPEVANIVAAASAAGYAVRRQGTFVPEADMLEGHCEARYVVKDAFAERVRAEGLAKEREDEILAYVPRVREALEEMTRSGIEKARAMDVWWAELNLEPKTQ